MGWAGPGKVWIAARTLAAEVRDALPQHLLRQQPGAVILAC